jgi:hypothetical protein
MRIHVVFVSLIKSVHSLYNHVFLGCPSLSVSLYYHVFHGCVLASVHRLYNYVSKNAYAPVLSQGLYNNESNTCASLSSLLV